MERYYRIEFTGTLQKLTLAFKMECEIEVFWKRGEKIAQTGKVPFKNCTATFNKDLTISCNMIFDTQNKIFKPKETKFAIVIYTQKGNKQAGQILFDVAPFLNEKNQQKQYELGLSKCPDKSAKLFFKLRAQIMEEKTFDTLSQKSFVSLDIQALTNKQKPEISYLSAREQTKSDQKIPIISIPQAEIKSAIVITSKNKQKAAKIVPTTDRSKDNKRNQVQSRLNTDRTQYTAQTIKNIENQNKKIKQQLKRKEQLKKQNEELKRRLKDDDYESCKQYKKKIEQGKKQIEQLVHDSKGAKKANDDIKKLEKQILRCKQHIMRIFNDAEKFGPQAMDRIQEACGIREY